MKKALMSWSQEEKVKYLEKLKKMFAYANSLP